MSQTSQASLRLLGGVAEILEELAGEVECLGESLCADPDVIVRHMDQLQGIDLIAQTARQLAMLVGSDNPAAALGDVRLEALRRRLHDLVLPGNSGEMVALEG
ncbi:hypothetical protein D2V17_01010 [Aurantiacibacter xanthus]|uniref:Uncharacterized protein n=1 Tax=Aurantiacibacter xanthus TaxID=1784712 RepID=A0A3A1PJ87_9SPHN|nr:hypothetical protein [Aurantiacibacter xanthus]RIV92873.1 hypothetical protein D2V17_01010 [Aurantiacibacter xanthus]